MLVTTARRKYRDEWVALRVRRTDRADIPIEGDVVLHVRDRRTFEEHEQAYRAAHSRERLYVFFAGDPIPEGLGVCLGKWWHMPANLHMKTVSDQGPPGQHMPAARHSRSPQAGARTRGEEPPRAPHSLTPAQVLARVRRLRLRTPRESARMIRADRNAR